MDNYGYYKKRKRQRVKLSWWQWLIRITDIVMLAATAVCLLLLVCSYLARYISPADSSFFALPGLVFPILYVAGVICTLYWIVRWKRYAIVSAAVLLLGIGNVRLFYQWNLFENRAESKTMRNELVVMSYNLMNFMYSHKGENLKPEELIPAFVNSNHVDIWCAQEFAKSEATIDEIRNAVPDLKYSVFRDYIVSKGDAPTGIGLAIYSRYPVVESGFVTADDAGIVRAVWADIKIKRDTVRVVNSHLQSTYIKDSDVDYLSSFRIVTEDRGRARLREIISKLNENYVLRAPQAEAISAFVKASPYPVILCGDFNDTPVSYAYQKMKSGLKDTFVQKGRGTAGTYNGYFNMFRIDYIFMSPELQVLNYYPFDVVYSDHNPIAASFDFIRD